MPSAISELAAAPPPNPTVAASPSFPSMPTQFPFSSSPSPPTSHPPASYASPAPISPSSSASSASSEASLFSALVVNKPKLDARNLFWPSISTWPASYGPGNIYSYYSCPPGFAHFGCQPSVPVTIPVASATAVWSPPLPSLPPPLPATTTAISASTDATAPSTPVFSQTSVASTAETVTSSATDAVAMTISVTRGGDTVSTLVTMSAISTISLTVTTTPATPGSASAGGDNNNLTNRTTVVVLSSVLSVVSIIAVAGLVFICCRFRQRRGGSFFPRGISPIDDDEIEAWKGNRSPPGLGESEKRPVSRPGVYAEDNYGPDSPPLLSAGALGAGATVQRHDPPIDGQSYPERAASLDSPDFYANGRGSVVSRPPPPPRKAPTNVIIYKDPPQSGAVMPSSETLKCGPFSFPGMATAPETTLTGGTVPSCFNEQQRRQRQVVPLYRRSEEFSPRSARSMSFGYPASRGMAGRFSLDQDRDVLFSQALASPQSPRTALQHARAPNSRAGLTDETIPGDPSFLPAPKRLPSRLLKMPPATGSPSVTAAATAAATTGSAGAYFVPRRNSHSANGSNPFPLPSGKPPSANSSGDRSNDTIAALWHARTRSARSCSTVSYAGSEVALNKSFGQPPYQRRPSVVHYQPMVQPQATMPSQQLPTSVIDQHLPAPPLPVSTRSRRGNDSSEDLSRRSSHSMYHEYLHNEKQPREASSSSTFASSSSSLSIQPQMGTAVVAAGSSDNSDGPLLGGLSPPRPRIPDSPHDVHGRSSSHGHSETIGRAIG